MLRSDGTGKQAEERGTSQWYRWVMGEGWCIHQNLLMASQLRGSNFGGRSSFGASGRASGSASTDRGGGTLAARVKFPTTSPASSRPPKAPVLGLPWAASVVPSARSGGLLAGVSAPV
jgi:hypothetical protein